MRTNAITPTILTVVLAACSSTQTTTRVTAANAAHAADGTTITTGPSGQAVSATANEKFNTAAASMRTHDEANDGRGDWANDVCTQVAGQFEEAANAQPNGQFAEAWFNRGLVYDRCGMNDQATQSLQRSVQAGGGNFCRAKVQLGVMAFRRRDTAAAQSMFEEAIRQDPTHCVEGYTNLAMVMRERHPTTPQEWAPVIRNIRAALALDDRYLPARNELALAYLQQAGDDPNSRLIFLAGLVCAQAIQVAQVPAGQNPANALTPEVRSFVADLHNTWGIIDIRRNEIIKAQEHFRRAYTLNPNMFQAWVNYGTINLSFRGYADARDAFTHAVTLQDTSYDAHIGLGVALRGLAQTAPDAERTAMLTQAQAEYERARTLDANRADAYYNLGVLNMNYMDGTIPTLQRALQQLQDFVNRASSQARFADAVVRANRHMRNIRETITALQAVGSNGGTPPATPPATPAPGATPAPAEGATPPAAAPTPAAPAAAPTPAAH